MTKKKIFFAIQMSSLCGVPSCKCKEKQYGVCGRHKSYSYKNNDPQFNLDIQPLIETRRLFGDEMNLILSKGLEPLDIQKYYGNDLVNKQLYHADKDFEEACRLMNEIPPQIEKIKAKYDHTLVMNVFARINHLGTDCNCELCSLGT